MFFSSLSPPPSPFRPVFPSFVCVLTVPPPSSRVHERHRAVGGRLALMVHMFEKLEEWSCAR